MTNRRAENMGGEVVIWSEAILIIVFSTDGLKYQKRDTLLLCYHEEIGPGPSVHSGLQRYNTLRRSMLDFLSAMGKIGGAGALT